MQLLKVLCFLGVFLECHVYAIASYPLNKFFINSWFRKTKQRPHVPLHFIVTGPPSVGKGTLCNIIGRKLGLIHISSGDLLRDSIASRDEYGTQLENYVKSGKLVPDDVVIEIIRRRLACNDCIDNGWLLDGFPRSQNQAIALQEMGVRIDAVINLDAPVKTILERGLGRVIDPVTGRVYHKVNNPPPVEVMDRVIVRSDDTKETLLKRYVEYKSTTEQLLPVYADKIITIDASQDIKLYIIDVENFINKFMKKI